MHGALVSRERAISPSVRMAIASQRRNNSRGRPDIGRVRAFSECGASRGLAVPRMRRSQKAGWMATQKAGPSRRARAADVGRTAAELLSTLVGSHAAAVDRLLNVVRCRTPRHRLALIAVPLGICAAVLGGTPWMVAPLCAGAWWWLADDWGWSWLGALGRGVITIEWAAMGANALATFPGSTVAVSGGWIAGALLFAVIGHRGESR
jgi:hypothetical protein